MEKAAILCNALEHWTGGTEANSSLEGFHHSASNNTKENAVPWKSGKIFCQLFLENERIAISDSSADIQSDMFDIAETVPCIYT